MAETASRDKAVSTDLRYDGSMKISAAVCVMICPCFSTLHFPTFTCSNNTYGPSHVPGVPKCAKVILRSCFEFGQVLDLMPLTYRSNWVASVCAGHKGVVEVVVSSWFMSWIWLGWSNEESRVTLTPWNHWRGQSQTRLLGLLSTVRSPNTLLILSARHASQHSESTVKLFRQGPNHAEMGGILQNYLWWNKVPNKIIQYIRLTIHAVFYPLVTWLLTNHPNRVAGFFQKNCLQDRLESGCACKDPSGFEL